MTGSLVVIGDCLLDRDVTGVATRLTPDAPAPVLEEREVNSRPGGAGLAAVLAARDGRDVTLVTALAADAAADELRALLARAGVALVDLGSRGATPEKTRLCAGGHSMARWDRGGRTEVADIGGWSVAADAAVDDADAVLVSCYGRGVSDHLGVRRAIEAATARVPVVWDPHPRGPAAVEGTTVVTPNAEEARSLVPQVAGDGLEAVARRASAILRRWSVRGCAITLGRRGALYTSGDGLPLIAPAVDAGTADPCGAGDRFASSLAGQLADGRVVPDAIAGAVHLAAGFVAAGGAGSVRIGDPPHLALPATDAFSLAEQVRARGGVVVATGGCFDIVHTGHVQLLQAARALGDVLIVCLNSDASVRRLKGADRPIVAASDRAELLQALTCVDAVVVFEEDTPVDVLTRLRPDVFAKGGDYGSTTIPEAEALASWNGQAVTLPYLAGRSTTRLLREVRQREYS